MRFDGFAAVMRQAAETVDKDRAEAYRLIRRGLLQHADELLASGSSPDKIIGALSKLDELLGEGDAREEEANPLDAVADYLNGLKRSEGGENT